MLRSVNNNLCFIIFSIDFLSFVVADVEGCAKHYCNSIAPIFNINSIAQLAEAHLIKLLQ